MTGDNDCAAVYTLLGLCMRAGKLKSGRDSVLNAVRTGEARLVIIPDDASEGTKKLYRDKCSFYGSKLIIFGNMQILGHALGKEKRAAVAVTDDGFAKTILKKLNEG